MKNLVKTLTIFVLVAGVTFCAKKKDDDNTGLLALLLLSQQNTAAGTVPVNKITSTPTTLSFARINMPECKHSSGATIAATSMYTAYVEVTTTEANKKVFVADPEGGSMVTDAFGGTQSGYPSLKVYSGSAPTGTSTAISADYCNNPVTTSWTEVTTGITKVYEGGDLALTYSNDNVSITFTNPGTYFFLINFTTAETTAKTPTTKAFFP